MAQQEGVKTNDKEMAKQQDTAREENNPKLIAVHPGIVCDGCGQDPLRGIRFKCTVCADFDLCKACEASYGSNTGTSSDRHKFDHPMLKLVTSKTSLYSHRGHFTDGGYDVRMFENEEEYSPVVCHVCLAVARDPLITKCGHIFCSTCLLTCLAVREVCPLDRQPVTRRELVEGSLNSADLTARVAALAVRCPNFDLSCTWRGTLSQLSRHTRDCSFEECPFAKYGCTVRTVRKNKVNNVIPSSENKNGGDQSTSMSISTLNSTSNGRPTDLLLSPEGSLPAIVHLSPDSALLLSVDHEHKHVELLESFLAANTSTINRFHDQLTNLSHHLQGVLGFCHQTQIRLADMQSRIDSIDQAVGQQDQTVVAVVVAHNKLATRWNGTLFLVGAGLFISGALILYRERDRRK